jgi:hypothetical protein
MGPRPLMEEWKRLCGNELLFPALLDWNLCCDLIETLLAKRLDTACLLVKSSTKPHGNFALGDNFRKLGSLSRPSSDSDVWVPAMTVRWFGNDLRSVRSRQRDRLRDGDVLLVQDSLKLRFIEDLLVNSIFSLPENLFLLCGTLPCEIKCPYLDLSDFLRIKHAHSDCVGPLVRQMSPDPLSVDIVLDGLDLGIGGATDMSENANRRTRSSLSTSGLDGLIEAARAVVTAHTLRDDDMGSDDDVSDAIANLGRLLPRQRRRRRATA